MGLYSRTARARTILLSLVFTAPFFAFAAEEADPEEARALKDLHGAWETIWLEKGGVIFYQSPPKKPLEDWRLIFTGKMVTRKDSSGLEHVRSAVRLDPRATPKVIDITPMIGPAKGHTLLGIYKIDGDVLTICGVVQGVARPKEFATSSKIRNSCLFKYRRVKAAKP